MRARGTFLVALLLLSALQLLSLYAPGARAQTAARLLFTSGFEEGVYLEDPYHDANQWWQYLRGQDEGYVFPDDLPGTNSRFQYLVGSSVPRSQLSEHAETRIDTVTGHHGNPTRALYLEIKKDDPNFDNTARNQYNVNWKNSQTEAYIRFWMMLQPNLESAMPNGGWHGILEWRESGDDYRWGLHIGKNSKGLYWKCRSQWGSLGSSPVHWDEPAVYDPPPESILGEWALLELHWIHSTGSDGLVHIKINGETIIEHHGRNKKDSGLKVAWFFKVYTKKDYLRDYGKHYRWFDDLEIWDTVPDKSLELESWENGFEERDFSAWNGTQTHGSGIAPSRVMSPTFQGSYAANFSTSSGVIGSYSRARHQIRSVTEVYQRSYVRYATLPDVNDTNIWALRIGREDDSWIASAGILRLNGNYYWHIGERSGVYNYTLDSDIQPDTWYSMEFYVNATTKGNAILWINNVKKCEMTGDFSGYTISRVYPYIYISGGLDDVGNQMSGKTLYHDNYRVDRTRIGVASGTPIFQTSAYLLTSVEGDPVRFSTLEGVRINGTQLTDASGYYEWAGLAYNKVYTFVIEKPAGHYPAWVLNVEGSYTWNGTHYILRHNVTETQTGPIEIYFSSTEEVYIKSSTHKLTSVLYNSSSQNPHTFMRFKIAADIGATSRLEIYTADKGHPRPYKIEGATDWSYDWESEILTAWISHTSVEEAEIQWRGAAMGQ